MNHVVVAFAMAVAIGLGGPTLANPSYGEYGYHPMMGWGGWFMGPVMMLLFVAFLVGALLLVVRVLGWHPGSGAGPSEDRALAVLRERFARGEIDQTEFEARKKALE
jgi:putative membrane protein